MEESTAKLVYNEMNPDTEVIYRTVPKKWNRRAMIVAVIVILIFSIILFILTFVVFPLIFMKSVQLQRLLMFTNLNLPTNKTYFSKYRLPGLHNTYVSVRNLNNDKNISLGVWHLLPVELTYEALKNENFSYADALKDSKYGVILYFHGTGEARNYQRYKYEIFRHYFHVITFDYRSYADSSKGVLTEDEVSNDCVQLYKWLLRQTNSPIYVWGHSLGTALATRTVATIYKNNDIVPKGLILEAAFTSMHDELYDHPYGKIFAWLPWFKDTVLDPLQHNGFIFDTATNILNVNCPIMLMHAEDDHIVPYRFSEDLYNIVKKNKVPIRYYHFDARFGYDHNYVYEDPYYQYLIIDFQALCNRNSTPTDSFIHRIQRMD